MQNNVPEQYKKMQDRFSLPRFEDLTETFKFEIDNNHKLIDQIRIEMSDKLFSIAERIIEPLIGGADTFSCIFEQDMVSESEREKLFALYKKVQVLKWENHLLAMRPNEKQTAEWINKAWDLWNSSLVSELSFFCRKMSENWTEMSFKEEKTSYHG